MKDNKTSFTYKNFIDGAFNPKDFNFRFQVRRIRRVKIDKNRLHKAFLAKIKVETQKYADAIKPINSWYYSIDVVCDDFQNIVKEVQNAANKKIQHNMADKITNCKSYGIMLGLRHGIFNGAKPRQFKSLADCQRWCDKHGIYVDVKSVYKKNK